jgi:hypothetical protein
MKFIQYLYSRVKLPCIYKRADRCKRINFMLPITYSLEIFTGRCPNRAWGGVVVKALRY